MVGDFQTVNMCARVWHKIHRLGNSAANMTCGRVLCDVGLWIQRETVVINDERYAFYVPKAIV